MGGPSLALPPGAAGLEEDAAEAVLQLNKAAGNIGRTVLLGEPHALSAANSHADVMKSLADVRGAVVFLHHVDPEHSLPGSNGFEGAAEIVSFASYLDDTTARARYAGPSRSYAVGVLGRLHAEARRDRPSAAGCIPGL